MRTALVVGGGPVGLFAALELVQHGIEPIVLERSPRPHGGSRSIGLHPPSLELLDRLHLASAFVAEGVRVRRAHAFHEGRPLGSISFAGCAGRHRYVLTLPQHRSEARLASALAQRAPGALRRGVSVDRVVDAPRPRALCSGPGGERWTLEADAMFVAQGRNAVAREQLELGLRARVYSGHYMMIDAIDSTRFGADAAVFLHPAGLVESFPLPGGRRRWVARTDPGTPVTQHALSRIVAERTGHRLLVDDGGAPSAFRTERRLATQLSRGRIALLGDSAHVVSPIGGQGMNLGFLGAHAFVQALSSAGSDGVGRVLARTARRQRRRARTAARRAELNMWLGRPSPSPFRIAALRALLHPPAEYLFARMFTMRGLSLGV